MTMLRCLSTLLFVLLAAAATPGCRDAPLAENVGSNIPPIAHAGAMQVLEYDGSPVTITLDASGSTDADGDIVSYRWLSGNTADGGLGRSGPDPDDVERPTLTLGSGVWTFVLFTLDDRGGVSEPSTVTITVGDAVPPEITECSENALQDIAEDCRLCVCGQSDMCRTAISGCNQACWDFYTCVRNECGEVADDESALAGCVRANCASLFAGVGQYMPLEPCINRGECAQPCAASVTM